jgi:hypothetical protein
MIALELVDSIAEGLQQFCRRSEVFPEVRQTRHIAQDDTADARW